MTAIKEYLNFIRRKGRPLNEINPGSSEYALKVDDAFEAIQMLQENQLPILGGDILSEKSGKLVYAYQLWGRQYHSLNWYCDKTASESNTEFCERSYKIAKNAINQASKTAIRLGEKCYINLVV